jgi:hypothetical protein
MQHLTMKTVLCILHTKISHGTTLNALLLNGENIRIVQSVKEKLPFLINKQFNNTSVIIGIKYHVLL